MTESSPAVFIAIVLPPALDPVIISMLKSFPSVRETGTTDFSGIKGWRAFFKSSIPFGEYTALTPFIFNASLARVRINSSSETTLKSLLITFTFFFTLSVRFFRIVWISWDSSTESSARSLFNWIDSIGSIKRVCPVEDLSWTIPLNLYRYSSFTGTTYLPSLCVIMESWK